MLYSLALVGHEEAAVRMCGGHHVLVSKQGVHIAGVAGGAGGLQQDN